MPKGDSLKEYYEIHGLTEKQTEALRKGREILNISRDRGPTRMWRRLKKAIEAKYGHSCVDCGGKRGSRPLDIHHLDGNHDNNEETNLVLLCHQCHMGRHFINHSMSKNGRQNISRGIKRHWETRRQKYGETGAKNPTSLRQKGSRNSKKRWIGSRED